MDDLKRKQWRICAVFVAVAVVVCGGMFTITTSGSMGRTEVVRQIIIFFCVSVMAGGIGLATVLAVNKRKLKAFPCIMIMMLTVPCFLAGISSLYKRIRGLSAGPVKIENVSYLQGEYFTEPGSYQLQFWESRNHTSRGVNIFPDRYYISVSNAHGIVPIRIDASTYAYLNTNKPDVTVSYYPYINIADEVIYK